MTKKTIFGLTILITSCVSAPAFARDIKAMCYTSEDGERFITSIAPIAVPDTITTSYDMDRKLPYIAGETMYALGQQTGQNVGCTFEDASLQSKEKYWQNGNQPEADMVNFQRRLIEKGYKLFKVNRLDSGSSTPKGGLAGAVPPPDIHSDGQPLRFYFVVGMVPTSKDIRNPNCYSNIVTLPDKVDWKEWGSEGRAAQLAGAFKASFDEKCRRQGALEPVSGGSPAFDRGDGLFVYSVHPTDRKVVLP
jgi:hypothetical protein